MTRMIAGHSEPTVQTITSCEPALLPMWVIPFINVLLVEINYLLGISMFCQLSNWHGCTSLPQTNTEETMESRSKHGSLKLATNHPPWLYFSLRLMAQTLILLLRKYSNVLSSLDFLPPARSARSPKGHLIWSISSGPIYAALGLVGCTRSWTQALLPTVGVEAQRWSSSWAVALTGPAVREKALLPSLLLVLQLFVNIFYTHIHTQPLPPR